MAKVMALKSVFTSVEATLFTKLVHFAVAIEEKDE